MHISPVAGATTEMEITNQLPDGSSPLATVEQIRNRLVRRPSLLHSPSSSTSFTRPREEEDATRNYSSRFDASSIELRRRRDRNKRLEDYLDPTLLAAVLAEIGGKHRKRGGGGGGRKVKEEVEFEWPVDELKAWTTSPEDSRRSERGVAKRDGGEAVDLGDDVDVIRGGGDDKEDGRGGVWCSPFRRFERTALKRFKG